jgi:predicted nucleic acid-binding protein
LKPCISLPLFAEYLDVLGRDKLFAGCLLNSQERNALFDALMSVCRMTEIYFLWRPNLPDEADNHVMELAVAAQAGVIVTHNRTDFGPPA